MKIFIICFIIGLLATAIYISIQYDSALSKMRKEVVNQSATHKARIDHYKYYIDEVFEAHEGYKDTVNQIEKNLEDHISKLEKEHKKKIDKIQQWEEIGYAQDKEITSLREINQILEIKINELHEKNNNLSIFNRNANSQIKTLEDILNRYQQRINTLTREIRMVREKSNAK